MSQTTMPNNARKTYADLSPAARFFLWCSAADPVLVAKVSTTTRHLCIGVGAAVCLTALFAATGMRYLLYTSFSNAVATGLGMLWGMAIFNVDRLLIGSMVSRHGDAPWRHLAAAVPRLFLAFLIAGAVSEPLLVRLFDADIRVQIQRDRRAELDALDTQLRTTQGAETGALDREERMLLESLAAFDSVVEQAHRAKIAEGDGTGGTGLRGRGANWSEKDERWRVVSAERERAYARLQPRLEAIRTQRRMLQEERQASIARVREALDQPSSPARQWAALRRMTQDAEVGSAIAVRVHLLRALLFSLELLPLWVKLLARRNSYDAEVQRVEDEAVHHTDCEREYDQEEARAKFAFKIAFVQAAETVSKGALKDVEADQEVVARARPQVQRRIGVAQSRFTHRSVGRHGDLGRYPHKKPAHGSPNEEVGSVSAAGITPPNSGEGDAHSRANGHFKTGSAASAAWSRLESGAKRLKFGVIRVGSALIGLRLWRQRTGRVLLAGSGVFAIGAVMSGVATHKYWGLPCKTGPCPVAEWLELETKQTKLVDRAGVTIGVWPGYTNVSLDSMPPYVAALAQIIEDQRFQRHSGVDWLAVVSAARSNITSRQRRGASTITMQCVRGLDNAHLMWADGGWAGKLAEARVAIDLERRATKRAILECWLAVIDLGTRGGTAIRGIEQGAQWWFGKPAASLSLAEAATLIGMARGPQLYRPDRHAARARARRDFVLRRMASADSSMLLPVSAALAESLYIIPESHVRRFSPMLTQLGRALGSERPVELRTSVDASLQRAAEGVISRALANIGAGGLGLYHPVDSNPLTAGAVIMRTDGRVLAYACGGALGLAIQWDRCQAIRLNSALKPFLLAAALDSRTIRREDKLGALVARLEREQPGNDSAYWRSACEQSRARFGWAIDHLMAESDNCLAVVLHQLLPPDAISGLNSIGLSVDAAKPATALGTGDISLLGLAALTAGIAGNGAVPTARFAEAARPEPQSPTNLPFQASTITAVRSVLAGVVASGTGRTASAFLPANANAFAKTGTGAEGAEYLITGGAGDYVVAMWLGHHSQTRPVLATASAGIVLGEQWATLLADALASDRRPPLVSVAESAGPDAITPVGDRGSRTPQTIRGVYVNRWVATGGRMRDMLRLGRETEINTLVIDVKDDRGLLLYKSTVPMARSLGADTVTPLSPRRLREILDSMRVAGLFPVARIVVVKDPILAAVRPDWTIRRPNGKQWHDRRGTPWLDAGRIEVWEYAADVAEEAVRLGFGGIQLDYARYPDDPSLHRDAQLPNEPISEIVRNGIAYVRSRLDASDVPLAVDVFGLTPSSKGDLGIGQSWARLIDQMDVIQPMMYPSHFPKGTYGIPNPAASPYRTVDRVLKDANRRSAGVPNAATIVPWYQDFTIGGVRYGAREVRAQIQAGYDNGINSWVLWNPSSRYSEGALRRHATTARAAPAAATVSPTP